MWPMLSAVIHGDELLTYDKGSGKVDKGPVGHETFPVPPACCGVGYRLVYCPAGTVQEETLADGEHDHAVSSALGSFLLPCN